MSGNFYPTPPPRSPWASPLVIGAIVAGVLVLALAVLLGFLLIPADEKSSATDSSTTTPPSTTTQQVSTKTETVTATTPPTTTPPTISTPRATPTVPGTDWQGFVSGPRCNAAGDPAVMIGQTARSNVVVCQVGTQVGRYYYKGLADGQSTELQFPTRSGDQFVAVNVDTTYEMTPAALTISTNGSVVAAEPMIYYWTN